MMGKGVLSTIILFPNITAQASIQYFPECRNIKSHVVLSANRYNVLRVQPNNELQLQKLMVLEKDGFDFWMRPRGVGSYADLMVSSEELEKVKNFLNENSIRFETWIDNVEQ
jgi:hypothetical protein